MKPRTKVTGDSLAMDLHAVKGESSAAKSVAMVESIAYLQIFEYAKQLNEMMDCPQLSMPQVIES